MRSFTLEVVAGLLWMSCTLVSGLPAPGDQHWAPQFGPAGVDATLYSVTASGGKLYVGGYPAAAGNSKVSFIAGYDGANWFALNNGLSGDLSATFVFALAHDKNYVYAGGWFTNADGIPAADVARWDGSNWSRMDAGLGGIVFALKMVGTNLYAGGIFPNTNGTIYNCLARWTGSTWSMIPGQFTGVQPVIETIETDGTNLYLGGEFDSVAGLNATNVARWDGTSWTPMSLGAGGLVRTLLWVGNQLYAGGAFTNATAGLMNTAVWKGTGWSPWANADQAVGDLVSAGSFIYAGGAFNSIGGLAATGIARWDGANWSGLGAGLQGFGVGTSKGVNRMVVDQQGHLIVVGNFNAVGTIGASYVAGWDGSSWFALGAGKGLTHTLGVVSALLATDQTLYAGGLFTEGGDQILNRIGAWDGANWSSVGGGVSGTSTAGFAPKIQSFAAFGGNLYAGGSFANAGGVSANNLARWDGASWWPLGNGPDCAVRALGTDGTYLYAGGLFTNVDGMFSPGFAAWDGNAWFSLGTFSGGARAVYAIAADTSNLYVAGSFSSIDGLSALNVARWDGAQWNALGSGLSGTVNALAITNGVLYAGGAFISAGGAPANRIAAWDGVHWSALGTGMSGIVNALALRGTDLFVGGSFTNAGGLMVNGLARWDGTNWSGLGSGLSNSGFLSSSCSALALLGNDVFVGGNFLFAGDKPAMFVARWNDQLNFYPPPQPRLINTTWQANGQFKFRLSGTSGEQYIIQASSDLVNWTPLLTNTAPLYDFTDAAAGAFPARLYRAILPSP